MMKTTNLFILGAAALAFASCSNEEEAIVTGGPVAALVTAGVSGPATRAIDNQWEQDAIGVRVTGVTGTTTGVTSVMADKYKNVKYTTTASNADAATFTAEAGQGIFFQDANETVTFAAYAPYQESAADALPGTDGVIAKNTSSQNTRELQKAFDFIYASGATASQGSPKVEFKEDNRFKHKMARLIITVKTSGTEGFSASEVTGGTYSLDGLKHDGTFSVTTGEANVTDDAEAVTDWSLSAGSIKAVNGENSENSEVTFTSILFPQTLAEKASYTFKAVIGGQTYKAAISPALESGKSYTYTITVKKTGLVVSGCTIEGWGEEVTGSGDATM